MEITQSKNKIDWQVVVFFGIAYLIAWPIAFIFGVDEKAIRADNAPIVAMIIIYLPKFAFTISGLILFWYTKTLKDLWEQLSRWRVHWKWYILAYFSPALLYFISAWISSDQPLSPQFEFPSSLWMLLIGSQTGILTYFFFRGGLGEEIGLRAFALSRLQSRHSPLVSSLIIGFWWGLWHLPAWMDSSNLEIAIIWLAVVSFSILFTWLYNNTMSLPIVMLFHASLNSFDDVYEHIFPTLLDLDWELPYIAGILVFGLIFSFVLKCKYSFQSRST